MARYFIELSFKGTDYHGWQAQPNAHTVQSEIEAALYKITGEKIMLTGAGRTDTGVHAESYTAHIDTALSLAGDQAVYKLNAVLPQSIAVRNIFAVRDDAHARYSAVSRSYRYTIARHKNPFTPDLSWYYGGPLELDIMKAAAGIIKDTSDFTSFCKLHSDVKNHICKIYEALWFEKDGHLIFEICANRFLRNMVRAIVGTLIETGKGKISLSDLQGIIEGKNRSLAGFSAPAAGLSLYRILYPDDIYLL